MRFAILLSLAWLGLFHCVGPAHGQSAERAATRTARALEVACGPGHEHWAPYVDSAARRYLVHHVIIVAVLRHESGCRMDAVGLHGESCAMQLRGRARNGHSRRRLARDPALCIATGARWLALRGVDCQGGDLGMLAGYNGRTCAAGRPYARRVLRTLDWIWGEMRKREEPRT